MAKLILTLNNDPQDEYIINKTSMTLGRKSENDIVIDNLAISGRHALIQSIHDDVFVEDLGSTNGTYVNGRLVKKQALSHGDIIGVGRHELNFVNPMRTAQKNHPNNLNDSATTANNQAPAAAVNGARQGSPATLEIPQGKLHILNGSVAGKELVLAKALTTLGKPGKQVAVISRRPKGYFLTHIEGNSNGQQSYPTVNAEPIGPKAYTLGNNDIIELAGVKMQFTLEE